MWPLAMILAGCTDEISEEYGDVYLFGLSEEEILGAGARYAPEVSPEVLLTQMESPFECWKFGDLCGAVGPEAGEEVLEALWAAAAGGVSSDALLIEAGPLYDAAMGQWTEDFFLSPDEEFMYDRMVGDVHRSATCIFPSVDYYPSNGNPGGYVRNRSGVTNLVLQVNMWTNTDSFNYGTLPTIALDGEGCGVNQTFPYVGLTETQAHLSTNKWGPPGNKGSSGWGWVVSDMGQFNTCKARGG